MLYNTLSFIKTSFRLVSLLLLINMGTPPYLLYSQCQFLKVSSGSNHTLALGVDGSLWAWGNNNIGQLGDGSFQNIYTPIQIGNSNDWELIEASLDVSFAIKKDGSLWAWGDNRNGKLGLGNVQVASTPTKVGTSKWISISGGLNYTFAVKSDNSLWRWGNGDGLDNDNTNIFTPKKFGNDSNWKFVSCSKSGQDRDAAVFLIKIDGSFWSIGHNGQGILGLGFAKDTLVRLPVKIGNDQNWKFISNSSHVAAIKEDGSLWTWGDNSSGALGNFGYYEHQTKPVRVGLLNDWSIVQSREGYTIAIKKDGSMHMAGAISKMRYDTLSGQTNYFVKVGQVNDWNDVSTFSSVVYAIKKDSTLWRWGSFINIKYPKSYCCLPSESEINFSICSTDSIIINKKKYFAGFQDGLDTIRNFNGCDSVIKIKIDLYQIDTIDYLDTFCHGEIVNFHGNTFDKNHASKLITLNNLNQNGCDSIINAQFKFLDLIEINEEILENNDSIKLKLKITGGLPPYKYKWSTGESLDSVFLNKNGIYSVTVSDENFCSVVKFFYFKSTKNEDNKINAVKLFQNESQFEFISNEKNIKNISLFLSNGNLIFSRFVNSKTYSIDRNLLAKGLIFGQLTTENGFIQNLKLVN